MINGTKQPHLHNSVHEAKCATKFLSQAVGRPVDVAAMIVVVGAARLDVKKKHETVAVLDSRELQRGFRRRPASLSPREVSRSSQRPPSPGCGIRVHLRIGVTPRSYKPASHRGAEASARRVTGACRGSWRWPGSPS